MQDRLKDVRSAAMSPINMVKNLLTPEAKPEDELEELRRRVAELEQRQAKAGGGRKKKIAPDPKRVPRSRL